MQDKLRMAETDLYCLVTDTITQNVTCIFHRTAATTIKLHKNQKKCLIDFFPFFFFFCLVRYNLQWPTNTEKSVAAN